MCLTEFIVPVTLRPRHHHHHPRRQQQQQRRLEGHFSFSVGGVGHNTTYSEKKTWVRQRNEVGPICMWTPQFNGVLCVQAPGRCAKCVNEGLTDVACVCRGVGVKIDSTRTMMLNKHHIFNLKITLQMRLPRRLSSRVKGALK